MMLEEFFLEIFIVKLKIKVQKNFIKKVEILSLIMIIKCEISFVKAESNKDELKNKPKKLKYKKINNDNLLNQ